MQNNMADQENHAHAPQHEHDEEHEYKLEETPIPRVEIDPTGLTPTSPEVISKYALSSLNQMSNMVGKLL